MGRSVVARGWYRRFSGPMIELRDVRDADRSRSKRARAWEWVARKAAALVLLAAGIVVTLVGLVP
jgi:hypothetical protein